MDSKELERFWTERYEQNTTGWDIGYPSTPLKEYFDQLENKDLKILIPGAGNSYEAEYLYSNGFRNVYVCDISTNPLRSFKERLPAFPESQLIHANFFELVGSYDLIIEQTFFCSFEPTEANRSNYGKQMHSLLKSNGRLVGLWFKHKLDINGNRPFGGNKEEYLKYLTPYFKIKVFEDCYNSIPPRMGNELFGIFEKSDLS